MKMTRKVDNDVIKTAKGIVRWFTSTPSKQAMCEVIPDVIKGGGWGLYVGIWLSVVMLGSTTVTGFDAIVLTGGTAALFFKLGSMAIRGCKQLSVWAHRED